ncbi:MAG: hypothetical protein CL609_12625 [Anaerolineaceae bacterium]|nr:hypothetical protein [Anaerolineaceae bacterium]
MTTAKQHHDLRSKNWVQEITFRPVRFTDLKSLEWEGAYIQYRKIYQRTFQKSCEGKTLMWAADLPNFGIVAQVFIQLESNRLDLADGTNKAYLYAFRVRPAYRNQGLGIKMLDFAEKDIWQRGFNEMTLNVAQKNEAAIRLYQRTGYTIIGYEKGDWTFRDHHNNLRRIIEPAWKMSKKLSF